VRYKNEARFIQIPWLTFSKLVEAYQKVREDYQKLRKRIQQEKANQRQ
jgi:site-specific DNA-adenine methylase